MVNVAATNGDNGAAHAHMTGDPFDCPLFRMLPDPLQVESRAKPHVWTYLHQMRVDEVGVPEYTQVLEEKHRQMERPNLLYPTGKDILVHIKHDGLDARDDYHPIEPSNMPDLEPLVAQIDERLMDHTHVLMTVIDLEERTRVLLEIIDDITEVVDAQDGQNRSLFRRGSGKVQVTALQLEGLKYLIIRDKVGMGPLEPMIVDPYIEDVSCSGLGPLFVEHRVFEGLKSTVTFDTNEQLDRFVIRLSEKIGRPVTFREPIVEAILPDGSRVNIVYGGDVSKRGSNFTLRKFAATPLSVLNLIETGSLNYEMAAYMSFMLRDGMNIFVSGETASGKTTLLNALTTFVRPDAKIVSIEDTPEVQLPHPNWTREVVRGSTKSDAGGSPVTMMDLLKAALRQRPNEIIIGEIRGEEGAIAFQAMQTGLACLATFHASSVEKLIQRLTGNPINIPRTYIDSLNVVVITSSVALPNGTPVRRVISINEIISYDPASDSFAYVEMFRWNPYSDTYEFVGYQNSYLLEQVIAPKRGISPNNRRRIYGELAKRAEVLKKLHQTQYTRFYDFYSVLSKAYREGLLR